MRVIGKLLILPVLLLFGLLRLVLKMAQSIYGFIAVWFWIFIGICLVYAACMQNWNQIILLALIAVASFLVLFGAVWIEILLEDVVASLKGLMK